MYDSSLFNRRQKKTWLLNLAKSFIMQAFGKTLPFSLPFSVNGEHP